MSAVVIGLTGPTGAGKSTAREKAQSLGFFVIDADKVARDVTKKGSPLLPLLENEFCGVVINGELDRKALAIKAFSNAENTKKLNSITHPFIIDSIKGIIKKAENDGNNFILLDAPTLFESGTDKLCQKTIGVLAHEEIRLERIIVRDNLSEADAKLRISAGKSDDFFKNNCDIILNNNADNKAFLIECEKLFKNILEKKAL